MSVNLQVQEDSSDRGADVAAPRPRRRARRAPLAERMSLRGLRGSSRDLAASFAESSLADSIGAIDDGKNNSRLRHSVAGHMPTAQAARLVAIEVFGGELGQEQECMGTPGPDSMSVAASPPRATDHGTSVDSVGSSNGSGSEREEESPEAEDERNDQGTSDATSSASSSYQEFLKVLAAN